MDATLIEKQKRPAKACNSYRGKEWRKYKSQPHMKAQGTLAQRGGGPCSNEQKFFKITHCQCGKFHPLIHIDSKCRTCNYLC
jgi:hypothetical protein